MKRNDETVKIQFRAVLMFILDLLKHGNVDRAINVIEQILNR